MPVLACGAPPPLLVPAIGLRLQPGPVEREAARVCSQPGEHLEVLVDALAMTGRAHLRTRGAPRGRSRAEPATGAPSGLRGRGGRLLAAVQRTQFPRRLSCLNHVQIFFSVVQRKALTPNDFSSLAELQDRLAHVPTTLRRSRLTIR